MGRFDLTVSSGRAHTRRRPPDTSLFHPRAGAECVPISLLVNRPFLKVGCCTLQAQVTSCAMALLSFTFNGSIVTKQTDEGCSLHACACHTRSLKSKQWVIAGCALINNREHSFAPLGSFRVITLKTSNSHRLATLEGPGKYQVLFNLRLNVISHNNRKRSVKWALNECRAPTGGGNQPFLVPKARPPVQS